MKEEGFLLTLAQVGIAFAGFSGLITVFRKSEKPWTLIEIAAVKLILQHTLGLFCFSLLPVFIFYWHGSEKQIWRISSIALAGFFWVVFVYNWQQLRRLTKDGHVPAHPKMLKRIFFPKTAAAGILQIFNIFFDQFLLYSIGLACLIFSAVIQFWVSTMRHTSNEQ
ncbi:MAG: hypothetical protein Q8O71_03970 [bacterium]|nr:hypothetical protein [bacterium]